MPVVALLGEVEYDDAGLARDKSSDMATVLLTAPDGRRALLAFSGMEAMRAGIATPVRSPSPLHWPPRPRSRRAPTPSSSTSPAPAAFTVAGADLRRLGSGGDRSA